MTAVDRYIDWAQDQRAMYLGEADLTAGTVTNVGSFPGLPPATLVGGATLVPDQLVQGSPSISFDGTGYVDTGYLTRTNLVFDPAGASKATHHNKQNAEVIIDGPSEEFPGVFGVSREFKAKINAEDGYALTEENSGFGGLVGAGTKMYCARLKIKVGEDSGPIAVVLWPSTSGVIVKSAALQPGMEATIEIGPMTITEASAGKFSLRIGRGGSITPGHTMPGEVVHFWRTDVQVCEASAPAALPPFFPTPEQLASGLAGWAGTPNESESDIGPFARGVGRTFMGVARYPSGITGHTNTIFGGPGTNRNAIGLSSAEERILITLGNGTTGETKAVATSFDGQVHVLAVAFDPVTKKAAVYQDGVLLGTTGAFALEPSNAGQSFLIGKGGGNNFTGSIALPTIYPDVLSGEEVMAATRFLEAKLFPTYAQLDAIEPRELPR